MISFLWRVRRQLSAYRNYIRQLDTALEALTTTNKRILGENYELKVRIRLLKDEIASLEDEFGDCDDDDDDEMNELIELLKDVGLSPYRAYSVGELLEIKTALQGASHV